MVLKEGENIYHFPVSNVFVTKRSNAVHSNLQGFCT